MFDDPSHLVLDRYPSRYASCDYRGSPDSREYHGPAGPLLTWRNGLRAAIVMFAALLPVACVLLTSGGCGTWAEERHLTLHAIDKASGSPIRGARAFALERPPPVGDVTWLERAEALNDSDRSRLDALMLGISRRGVTDAGGACQLDYTEFRCECITEWDRMFGAPKSRRARAHPGGIAIVSCEGWQPAQVDLSSVPWNFGPENDRAAVPTGEVTVALVRRPSN